nr:hypothetical protein [Tanacetum cinerariifolium]
KYMPPKPDLAFADEHVVSKSVTSLPGIVKSKAKTSELKLKTVSDLIIEEWVSNDEEEDVSQPKIEKKIAKPSFVKINFVKAYKTAREIVKQYDYDYHQSQFNNQRMEKPVWNNARRVNHQHSTRMTHLNPKRNIVPRTVLTKSGLILLNTAQTKRTVNGARTMPYFSKTTYSSVKRHIN